MQLETRDGLVWPQGDRLCYPTVLAELDEIPQILEFCERRRSCIQAGGNAGLWPRALAPRFGMVYTAEPDRTLFHCLVNNVTAENVVFLNAALGSSFGRVSLDYSNWPGNVGSQKCSGPGVIPTLTIDSLGVEDCDLIQLDIEGAELFALQGAVKTIKHCRPVIVVELRGNAMAFGHGDETVREYLDGFGYKRAARLNYDEVYLPCE